MRLVRGLLAAWLVIVGCGSTSPQGDDVDISLPNRNGDGGLDGARDATPPPPKDAGVDVVVPSTFCTSTNLLLCLPFEGSFEDLSPQKFAPTTSDAITYITGIDGQAAFFSAASALRYAASPLFNVQAATIEAWIRRDTNQGEGVLFDADGRFAMVSTGSQIKCAAGDANTTGGVVPLSTWTHVACVFTGQKLFLYVDGVLTDQDNGKPQTNLNGTEAIGGNAPSGAPFVGGIDSFRVFNVARTADEILAAAQKP